MVSTNIIDVCLLNDLPDLRRFQVLEFISICGSKIGTHGAVVACDDDTAAACREGGILEVFCAQTGGFAGLGEGVSVLVLSNTTDVDN
jgi:hypothetical protein